MFAPAWMKGVKGYFGRADRPPETLSQPAANYRWVGTAAERIVAGDSYQHRDPIIGTVYSIESLLIWTALIPATWLVVTAFYHLLKPYSLLKTARRVDIDLSLFERLSTCLVLPEESGFFSLVLVSAQERDALQSARAVKINSAYPFKFNRSSWVKTAITSAVVFALIFLPNPMDEIIAARKAIMKEAQNQAKEIEDLQEQVKEAVELEPEQRQEIERLLTELAAKLYSNPGDLDQALADLSSVEREYPVLQKPECCAARCELEITA